jgi:hypothetical protein
MDDRASRTCAKALEILRRFDEVKAVGLAGSQALGEADQYSDVDLQVFTVSDIPDVGRRREAYDGLPGVRHGPIDHSVAAEFDSPPFSVNFVVDWLTLDGIKCDFLWLAQPDVDRLLGKLGDDPDHPETIAVLAGDIGPVFDPGGYIRQLRDRRPAYTEERARGIAARSLAYAHWFVCDWRVLEKALYRKDVIAYQAAETEMVEQFIVALYAVNRAWRHNRRRLRFRSRGFAILPEGCADRIESMILRCGAHRDLESCHRELRMLFRDLAIAANEKYPEWNLPTEWLD